MTSLTPHDIIEACLGGWFIALAVATACGVW